MATTPKRRWIGALALPLALVLAGCTAAVDPPPSPEPSASSSTGTSAPEVAVPQGSAFQQQLPLSGTFLSQAAETSGSARIERRDDGSVWVVLEDFRTGAASDLRLYLKPARLVQDADGHWGAGGGQWEIASLDPAATTHEIEVPGAHDMPAIHTLTVMDYALPDFPSFGSVALE
ncbi:hypothetical protein [Agrococcus beijingensis]|uniref:hypothetical protein n=1 Tax=Agrococcus beijingensis TaxID=3068634 RepID=UPI0027429A17|nr:hypothetical protein [Agrococcus sp. REN33]